MARKQDLLDVLEEMEKIEGQIGSIQREFVRQKESGKLTTISHANFYEQIAALYENRDSLNERLATIAMQLGVDKSVLEDIDNKFILQQQVEELEKQVKAAQGSLKEIEDHATDLTKKLFIQEHGNTEEVKETSPFDYKEKYNDLLAENKALKGTRDNLINEVKPVQEEIAKIQEELVQLEGKGADKAIKQEKKELSDYLKRYDNEFVKKDVSGKFAKNQEEIATLEEEIATFQADVDARTQEITKVKAKIEEKKAELANIEKQLSELPENASEQKRNELNNQKTRLTRTIQDKESDLKNKEAALSAPKSRLDAKKSRRDQLVSENAGLQEKIDEFKDVDEKKKRYEALSSKTYKKDEIGRLKAAIEEKTASIQGKVDEIREKTDLYNKNETKLGEIYTLIDQYQKESDANDNIKKEIEKKKAEIERMQKGINEAMKGMKEQAPDFEEPSRDETAQPTQSARPAQPARPAQSAQPARPAQSAQPAQQGQPVQSAGIARTMGNSYTAPGYHEVNGQVGRVETQGTQQEEQQADQENLPAVSSQKGSPMMKPHYLQAIQRAYKQKVGQDLQFDNFKRPHAPLFGFGKKERNEYVEALYPETEVDGKGVMASANKRELYALKKAGVTPEILRLAMMEIGVINEDVITEHPEWQSEYEAFVEEQKEQENEQVKISSRARAFREALATEAEQGAPAPQQEGQDAPAQEQEEQDTPAQEQEDDGPEL